MRKNQIAKKIGISILTGTLIFQSVLPLNTMAASDNKVEVATVAATEVIQKLTVGQVYEGFKLEKKVYSNDLNADMYLFISEKNGGQLVYIDAPDKNKWFTATFRTPTIDNTGVNHIFEHTVLEGSEKFNVKSPFTEMGKRSVNTFMNAMTGIDMTYYPIASENDKDFDNLMKVYLDAVFAPLVLKNENIFQQEGWRYEINPETGKLMFNGIVFNEMKGAMSYYGSVLYKELKDSLYPDTKYKYNSGGDPINIVDLTHEELVSKHAKYYTASNACLLFYGHMDIVSKLKYINDEYYSKMDKQKEILDLKVQKPFEKPIYKTAKYPANTEATVTDSSILIQSTALSDITAKEKIALDILSIILSQGDSSPYYTEMVKSGLGNEISVSNYTDFYQPAFTIILEGASNKSMSEFEKTSNKILQDLATKGIDKKRIESIISQFELSFKDALLKSDRGESAIDAMNSGFVVHGDPLMNFNQAEILKEIKKEAIEGSYFENLIKKYLIGNKHQANIVLEPDANYMANINKELDAKLEMRVAKMTSEEKKKIEMKIEAYKKYQAIEEDAAALDTLPKLEIKDLDLVSRQNGTKEGKLGDVKLFKNEVDALGLAELTFYFDLKTLTETELEYMSLFNAILANADTKNYTNEALNNEIDKYTMGINFYESCYGQSSDLNKYYPYFIVKTKYDSENSDKVSALMLEKILRTKFDNKELVQNKIKELIAQIERQKTSDPHGIVSAKMGSALTAADVFNNNALEKGFNRLKENDKNFEKNYVEIEKNLKSIYGKVFNAQNLTVSISTDKDSFVENEKSAKTVIDQLNKKSLKAQDWKLTPKVTKAAYIIPAEVQFMQLGFNLKNVNEKITGQDLVFAKILSDGYMYENIRVKGGAYGGAMWVSADDTVRFMTYRDPRLKESLDVINNATKYLKEFKPTEAEINNTIISVVGSMDQGKDLFEETELDTVRIMTEYDYKAREELKKEILSTKISDLEAFIAKMEKGMKNPSIVVAGSEKQINANKDMFDTIQLIQE